MTQEPEVLEVRKFEIVDGPSLWDCILAFADAVPDIAGAREQEREVTFLVSLVSLVGSRKPSRRRGNFHAKVMGMKRTANGHISVVTGTGVFPRSENPYWPSRKQGAPEDTYEASFTFQTRKGTLTLARYKGWEDIPIEEGQISVLVYREVDGIRIDITRPSSHETVGERTLAALGDIFSDKNLPEGVLRKQYGRPWSPGYLLASPEHAEEVLNTVERMLKGHPYLQGVQVEVLCDDDVAKLVGREAQ